MAKRLLIELDNFPFQEISEEAVREKSIHCGHISTLHVWWARKPLVASRATALAALLPAGPDSAQLLELVKQITPWKKSFDSSLFAEAQAKISATFDGPPRVLDPFAGGGSLPLEALRLGCESHALDYNPVAVLLNKAVLEYPQRFRQATGETKDSSLLDEGAKVNPLLDAVKKWGKWVLAEARQELASFYPLEPDGIAPTAYLWAHTVPCGNPSCGVQIPLLTTLWLAKKPNKKVALRLHPDLETKQITFEVVQSESIDFDPDQGTISTARVTCPLCHTTAIMDSKTMRRLFQAGKAGQRLLAIILSQKKDKVKTYRLATSSDLETFQKAEAALVIKRQQLQDADPWGIDPVPNEKLPDIDVMSFFPEAQRNWGALFNARQKLALITFASKVKEVYPFILKESNDAEFAKAVTTYLALVVDRQADSNSMLCQWNNISESIENTFGRQALPTVWYYVEVNPFSGSTRDYQSALNWVIKVLDHCCQVPPTIPGKVVQGSAKVGQGSATALPYSAEYFDAIFTNPPYHDNVSCSDLSDFFYVWLKRTVRDLHPELFITPLTPKSLEIVQDSKRQGGKEQAKAFFEAELSKAFSEIYRVLKPEGVALVVFAYKKTEEWEAIIKALLANGLYPTASWPINTEIANRLRVKNIASMTPSIYLVCHKRKVSAEEGDFSTVRDTLRANLSTKLESFWANGIRGIDFFLSAIGPTIGEFGPYAKVKKISGDEVTTEEWLKLGYQLITEFVLEHILEGVKLREVDTATRFYLLGWWLYGQGTVPLDEAKKLTQNKVGDLGSLVKQKGGQVQLLGPIERAKLKAFLLSKQDATLIDLIHKACLLLEANKREDLATFLKEQERKRELLRLIAQRLVDLLPTDNKEKQLLQELLQELLKKEKVKSMTKRLIESLEFPIQTIAKSASEIPVLSSLHVWWARHPSAASRAAILAMLLPIGRDKANLLYLVKQITQKKYSLDQGMLTEVRQKISIAFAGQPPRFLDPFAGGGTIPLEALRLGCEVHALDYNPIAVLINKAALEYPQCFRTTTSQRTGPKTNLLLEAVKKWGEWVLAEARQELASFYPPDPDGATPIAYLWARTVPCSNPTCEVQIPLLRQLWLVNKSTRKFALRLCPDPVAKEITLEIVEVVKGSNIDFDPDQGTTNGTRVTCPLCHNSIGAKTTRRLFQAGKANQRLLVVVLSQMKGKKKIYRLATPSDLATFQKAEAALALKRQQLQDADPWGIDPVPGEPMPDGDSFTYNCGMTTWGDLFSARQKLALITFAAKVKEAQGLIQQERNDSELTKAVTTYLALTLDRLADYDTMLCIWKKEGETLGATLGFPILQMSWNYCEVNPLSGIIGDYQSALNGVIKVLDHCSQIPSTTPGKVVQGSATALPYLPDYFDAIFADPPYYDTVFYNKISDFFYVWLRRILRDLHSELFSTPLTPKKWEILQDAKQHGGEKEAAKTFFETNLKVAFREIYRVLKPEGLALVVFNYKTTEAWETLITILLEVGLYPTASWPLDTVVYLVCRKRKETAEDGDYKVVQDNLRNRIRDTLISLEGQELREADLLLSAIGPAIEVFGIYAQVKKVSGEVVSIAEWLGVVQQLVAEVALEEFLEGGTTLKYVDKQTIFYLLARRNYKQGAILFGEANKLAWSLGVEFDDLKRTNGIVKHKGGKVQLLGPKERANINFSKIDSPTLIDLVHQACILLKANKHETLTAFLREQKGQRELLRLIVQTLDKILPPGNEEKRLLQMLLENLKA